MSNNSDSRSRGALLSPTPPKSPYQMNRSATAPVPQRRRMAPPSPTLPSNLDCAFPPFPNKQSPISSMLLRAHSLRHSVLELMVETMLQSGWIALRLGRSMAGLIGDLVLPAPLNRHRHCQALQPMGISDRALKAAHEALEV
jgi:hypothetical protein